MLLVDVVDNAEAEAMQLEGEELPSRVEQELEKDDRIHLLSSGTPQADSSACY